jgi:hypothetical protein
MTDKKIVSKLDQALTLTCFEATPYKPPRHGENLNFEVNVVAESLGKMHKRATVEPNLPTRRHLPLDIFPAELLFAC